MTEKKIDEGEVLIPTTYRARVKETLYYVSDNVHSGLKTEEEAGEVMHKYVTKDLIGDWDPVESCLTTEEQVDGKTVYGEYYIDESYVERIHICSTCSNEDLPSPTTELCIYCHIDIEVRKKVKEINENDPELAVDLLASVLKHMIWDEGYKEMGESIYLGYGELLEKYIKELKQRE